MIEPTTEPPDPVLQDLGFKVVAPFVDDGGVQCQQPRSGKRGEDRTRAEEVIAVTVRDDDPREVFAGFADLRSELVAFVDGHEGVDEDGVSLAGNQRGGARRPRGGACGMS